MSARTLTLVFLALSAAFSSCCNCEKKKSTGSDNTTVQEPDYASQGYVKATVIRYELDGCNWMLELEDKSKKEPLNLSESFKTDGKKVWVKYSGAKGAVSICMAGEIVNISDIKERK